MAGWLSTRIGIGAPAAGRRVVSYPPYMSESASPSARIVPSTRSEPAEVEPASHTSSALASSS